MNWLWQNTNIHKISFHISGDRNHPDQKHFWSVFHFEINIQKTTVQIWQFQIVCRQLNIKMNHRQTSYISGTLVGNKSVDHSAVVGASPVDAAPNIRPFST